MINFYLKSNQEIDSSSYYTFIFFYIDFVTKG